VKLHPFLSGFLLKRHVEARRIKEAIQAIRSAQSSGEVHRLGRQRQTAA
jgi:hypothetical protein